MGLFAPKVNHIKKSGRVVGTNPDTPEFGQMKHQTGNPSRKNTLAVKKPGATK